MSKTHFAQLQLGLVAFSYKRGKGAGPVAAAEETATTPRTSCKGQLDFGCHECRCCIKLKLSLCAPAGEWNYHC